jgi:hypothetical protein
LSRRSSHVLARHHEPSGSNDPQSPVVRSMHSFCCIHNALLLFVCLFVCLLFFVCCLFVLLLLLLLLLSLFVCFVVLSRPTFLLLYSFAGAGPRQRANKYSDTRFRKPSARKIREAGVCLVPSLFHSWRRHRREHRRRGHLDVKGFFGCTVGRGRVGCVSEAVLCQGDVLLLLMRNQGCILAE